MRTLLTSPRARIALFGGALLALSLLGLMLGRSGATAIRDAVGASGPLGALVFVLLYAVLTVLLFPGALLSAAAGALFGVVAGSALTVAGATLGAYTAFLVGRRLGREDARLIAGKRMEAVDRWIGQRGFWTVLSLRLIPLVPFSALNYAAGVSGVVTRDYVLATAIGIIPGSIAFVVLGHTASHPLSLTFLLALVALASFAGVAAVIRRRSGTRSSAGSDEPQSHA